MEEQEVQGETGGGSEPRPAPHAGMHQQEMEDKHLLMLNTMRLGFVEQRLRAHGFMVDTKTLIDENAPISSGKVIMALGSKQDIEEEAICAAADDPDKYSGGVVADLIISSAEVYMWLFNVGDTVTYDSNISRGVVTSRPKRGAPPALADCESFKVGDKVLVPVLDQFPGGTREEQNNGDEFFLATISAILIVVPAKDNEDIEYSSVPDGYFNTYQPLKGERSKQLTVFLYLSSAVLEKADGTNKLNEQLGAAATLSLEELEITTYHPTCIVCKLLIELSSFTHCSV